LYWFCGSNIVILSVKVRNALCAEMVFTGDLAFGFEKALSVRAGRALIVYRNLDTIIPLAVLTACYLREGINSSRPSFGATREDLTNRHHREDS
jgi:hypothetical protein